jgi:DNA-binding NtrC family response regulator
MRRLTDRISEPVATFSPTGTTPADDLREIMGSSARVAEISDFVRKSAGAEVPILLTGETGTGKEVVARAIHAAGERAGREMVSVNCGAIPEPLFESELFGHLRGSFTGAERDRTGLVEAADGSTLFLDEVADIPLNSQVKLLRVLQEGVLRPVGATRDRPVTVRIVAATNSALEDAVHRGTFRQDLFYRLSVLRFRVPPLRERPEDIPHLIERFLTLYAPPDHERQIHFSRRALKALRHYPWPGNVRELENEIARVTTLAEGERIEIDDLSEEIRAVQQVKGAGSLRAALDFKERQMIVSCLEQTGWNKAEAARVLGMSRQNLYARIEYHNIPLQPADGGTGDVKTP